MHNLIELPKGKRVQDVLPHFAGVAAHHWLSGGQ